MCEQFARRQIAYAQQHGIKRVFLAARWSAYADGAAYPPHGKESYFLTAPGFEALSKENSSRLFARALERTVAEYNRIGAEVVVLAQVPQQRYHPKSVYYRIYNPEANGTPEAKRFVQQASVPYEQHLQLQSFSRNVVGALANSGRLKFVSFDSSLCGEGICMIGNESVSYYRDMDHLSPEGVRRIVGDLAPYF
ncbi:hypothetical protein HK414_09810 [Ramlibacter terrae]|uniref:SGNH domain-containing protein n=1 Tax=Ramlibacter terrae TaxID=2732511 RepID=A0ABX6P4M0_9BURK|nr:hypothetical protein HK414_09810 [Ramlibacter terrae]